MSKVVTVICVFLGICIILSLLDRNRKQIKIGFGEVGFLAAAVVLIGTGVWSEIKFTFGDVSFETSFEQSIAETNAEINSSIEEVRREIEKINKVVGVLSKLSPDVELKVNKIESYSKPSKEFLNNNAYSVLVFHKPENY